MADPREDRLQIMLTADELALLDDWRFAHRMPSRSAAVRELLRRGLVGEGFKVSGTGSKSKDYGVGEPGQADGNGLSAGLTPSRGPRKNGDDSRSQ